MLTAIPASSSRETAFSHDALFGEGGLRIEVAFPAVEPDGG
jgi:hypothetical protein